MASRSVAAATQLSKSGISAGPVVAIVAIVAAAAIILVVVVSYVFHHRALSASGHSASQRTAQWATQFGANPSLSSEPGKDEFSR
jgi:hypothetical protein